MSVFKIRIVDEWVISDAFDGFEDKPKTDNIDATTGGVGKADYLCNKSVCELLKGKRIKFYFNSCDFLVSEDLKKVLNILIEKLELKEEGLFIDFYEKEVFCLCKNYVLRLRDKKSIFAYIDYSFSELEL